jgi:hypothetical protein
MIEWLITSQTKASDGLDFCEIINHTCGRGQFLVSNGKEHSLVGT